MLLLPGAAFATVDDITVSATPNPVQAGDTIDVQVDVTLSDGNDADWQSTNITLVMAGETDIELYCGNDPNVTDTDGLATFTFMNLTVPANAAPGNWTVRVRTYDGNDECDDGAPGNDDEGESATYILGVIGDLTLTKTGSGPDADYTAAGQTLNYTFTVENTGMSPLAGPVTIDDDLTTNELCPNVNTVGNFDGNLDPGEIIECTASYMTVAGDVTATFVENCATASADGETSNESCETLGLDLGIQVDLVLCIDGSGSIDAADWTLQLDGTSAGLDDALNPDFLNGEVRVTAIVFATAANIGVGPTIIDSLASLNNFRTALEGLAQPGGSTDQAECITDAHAVMCPGGDLGRGDCPDNGVRRVIDVSTDGDPTENNCGGGDDQDCAVLRSNEAEAAGVDVINVIGVGAGLTVANAEEWVFPPPVEIFDASAMPPEFPMEGDEGFIVLVADFEDYEPAITAKIAAELSATFQVNKVWSDTPNPTAVQIQLTCDSGVVTEIDNMASEGDPAEFMITGFTPPVFCDAVEVGGLPPGYTKDESDCQDVDLADPEMSCDIVNTLNTATFTVSKTYNDGNMDPVEISLTCDTGLVTPVNNMATPGGPDAEFTVTGYTDPLTETCTATETEPTGYTWTNPMDCSGVNLEATGTCNVNNALNAATFTVSKTYDDANMDPVEISLTCDTGMVTPVNNMATPGGPDAEFTVTAYTDPVTETCTATEVVPIGYAWTNPGDCMGVNLEATGTCNVNNALVEINLAKTVNGPPTLEMDGTYTVLYTVTATNLSAGAGSYDLVDTFSPGSGITLNTATATYQAGTEMTQSGMLGVYPNFVTGEGLAGGLNESWLIDANFTVDPTMVNPNDSDCDPAEPIENTGFYNAISGSVSDNEPDDDATCEGLPDPDIDLIKTAETGAVLQPDGTYDVEYHIVAQNNGDGPGTYNLEDVFSPGSGITLNTAMVSYAAGTEDSQSGMLGTFPTGSTIVTGEHLAGQRDERWVILANFTVDPTMVSPNDSDCDPGDPVEGTGFYNSVSGVDGETNPGNNDACTGLPDPQIDLSKTVTNVVDNGGGSVTVTYNITANNLGDGPGFYDVVDTIAPAAGTIIVSATLTAYVPGSENDQSGTILGDGVIPEPFTSGQTLVSGEALAGDRSEGWTVVIEFDAANATGNLECAGPGTGTYNEVSGSETDPNPGNDSDCGDLPRLRTTFLVTKDFSDDNPAGVEVFIECNTGLPLQQSGVVHDPESNPGPGMFTEIEFVVGDFEPGTMDCDIEEAIPAGYVPTYTAGATTGVAGDIFDSEEGCHYELIEGGQFTCHIFNELQPVDVVVEKQWIDDHPEFQESTIVDVRLECDAPIENGFPCLNGEGGHSTFCAEQFIDPNNPGVFEVLPHFEGTFCTATEEPIVGVLTDESDCEEMIVFPGEGDSCVIVNTRLFAGIPTLNQYGLMLLALLMLGIGALAYRRFV